MRKKLETERPGREGGHHDEPPQHAESDDAVGEGEFLSIGSRAAPRTARRSVSVPEPARVAAGR